MRTVPAFPLDAPGRALAALLALLALLPASCSGTGRLVAPAASLGAARPARRTSGPRLPPPFRGADPASLGLARAEGLLWLRSDELASWPAGGVGVAPAPGSPPGDGLTLRTDHVVLRTDLGAEQALPLARAAQQHVEALLAAYGEALDLRLPSEPLPVVVSARRPDFEAALSATVPEPTGWNAYYDARDGVVRVCAEPAARAPLPLLSDLKHELTHAVLDLSAPAPVPHERILSGLHLWLWEGFAVHAETLGDPTEGGSWPVRRERFLARLARSETLALSDLLRLSQEQFEGRAYDQVASVMRFLMQDAALRPRTLNLLRRLLRGDVLQNDPARDLGTPLPDLERRWRASVAGGRP